MSATEEVHQIAVPVELKDALQQSVEAAIAEANKQSDCSVSEASVEEGRELNFDVATASVYVLNIVVNGVSGYLIAEAMKKFITKIPKQSSAHSAEVAVIKPDGGIVEFDANDPNATLIGIEELGGDEHPHPS